MTMPKLDFDISYHQHSDDYMDENKIVDKLKQVCQAVDYINGRLKDLEGRQRIQETLSALDDVKKESLAPEGSMHHIECGMIDKLNILVRTKNILQNDNILFLGDLLQRTESDLLKLPNFGKKTLKDLIQGLQEFNLKLKIKCTRKHDFDNGWGLIYNEDGALHCPECGAIE